MKHQALVLKDRIHVAFTRCDDQSEKFGAGDYSENRAATPWSCGGTRNERNVGARTYDQRSTRPASAIEDVNRSARKIKPVGLLSIPRYNEPR